MLIALAYCEKDAPGAANLLRWMAELDGQSRHTCLLVAANGLEKEMIHSMIEVAQTAFVEVIPVQTTHLDNRPWPYAPNTMFRCTLGWVKKHRPGSFFWWNEPDCIPLVAGWADALEAEYRAAKRPFMGHIVELPTPHLTGCAIYPSNVDFYNKEMTLAERKAFDCVESQKTLAFTHHTKLFHHQWINFDGVGVPTFPTPEELELISPEAVIFHRNKDHTLIDRLREDRALHRDRKIPTARTVVHTYYEDMDRPQELKVLDLWKRSWKEQGWYPVVMNTAEIVHVPGWKKCLQDLAALPSINRPQYEMACYKRWLTMVNRGGGLMVDYDVMNYGWTPDIAEKQRFPDALTFFEERVPSVVMGDKPWYRMALDYMRAYIPRPDDQINGRPHTSDMCILQRAWGTPWIKHQPVVVQYRNPGWKKAALVHYCNSQTGGDKVTAIKSR